MNWQEAVLNAASNVLSRFFIFLPSLFGALIIFFLGLVLAKWTKALIVKTPGSYEVIFYQTRELIAPPIVNQ